MDPNDVHSDSRYPFTYESDELLWFTKLAIKECNSVGRQHLRRTIEWPPANALGSTKFEPTDMNRLALENPEKKYLLPILLRFSLSLTIDEISQVLRLREKVILDRLDKGLQGYLQQINSEWSSSGPDYGTAKEHREFRHHLFQSAWLTTSGSGQDQSHLEYCAPCLFCFAIKVVS